MHTWRVCLPACLPRQQSLPSLWVVTFSWQARTTSTWLVMGMMIQMDSTQGLSLGLWHLLGTQEKVGGASGAPSFEKKCAGLSSTSGKITLCASVALQSAFSPNTTSCLQFSL